LFETSALSRRRLLGLGGLVAASAVAACQAGPTTGSNNPPGPAASPGSTTEPAAGITPTDALARLKAANVRFANGEATHPNQGVEVREAVAEHQHPWALIHGCVDSRVAPELVFDQGVGDVFTTRTGAAVMDDTIVGSMEFAVGSPYETPLIVILGHTGCGAVTATVEAMQAAPANPSAPGEVLDIVNEILPIARQVPPNPDKAAFVDGVVRANSIAVADALVRRSKIIRDAVDAGRTQIIPAVYDLATGRVSWLSATA
jgi:carbonic anhydrase